MGSITSGNGTIFTKKTILGFSCPSSFPVSLSSFIFTVVITLPSSVFVSAVANIFLVKSKD